MKLMTNTQAYDEAEFITGVKSSIGGINPWVERAIENGVAYRRHDIQHNDTHHNDT